MAALSAAVCAAAGRARATASKRSSESLFMTATIPTLAIVRKTTGVPPPRTTRAGDPHPLRVLPRDCPRPDGATTDTTYRCCLSTLAELAGRSPPGPGTNGRYPDPTAPTIGAGRDLTPARALPRGSPPPSPRRHPPH